MSILDQLADLGSVERGTFELKGKTFHVRSLSAGQRAALQRVMQEQGQIPEYITAAHGLINEDGTPIGPVEEVAAKLKELKGDLVSRICSAIYSVSALDSGALENAEKN